MIQPNPSLDFECPYTTSTEVNGREMSLCAACEQGDSNLIEQLILNGADVNGTDDGRPLIAAAGNGHKRCVQLLLQHGAKVNNLDRQGQSALMIASRNLFIDIVEVLLDAGAKPSIEDFDFQHCTEQLSLSCTRKLVNVLSANQLSFVKLSQFAFRNARLDLANYLLEKESDSTVAQHYSFGLYYATKHDWSDVARHLLDRGVRVNSFWNSKTALRCACKYGHLNIAQLLLKRGAKPYRHRSTKTDLLPIQFCCRNGNEELLKLLLGSSSSSRMSNCAAAVISRSYPLHIAYDNGHWNCIKLLLDSGVDVDCMDNNGLTVLHKAVKAGLISQVKTLIDHGVNILLVSPSSDSVLHMALPGCPSTFQPQALTTTNYGETTDMIRLLISSGADCNAVNALGETPLYRSCAAGLEDVVKIFLDAGCEDYVKNTIRRPLMAACAVGNVPAVELLLQGGALVNMMALRPEVGHIARATPLCIATKYGHCKTVHLLLQHGARTDVCDELGKVILEYFMEGIANQKQTVTSIGKNYEDTFELLLSHGVDVNMSNGMGDTPLFKASAKGLDEVVELLLSRGANPFLNASYGENPLMAACKNNYTKVAELLLAFGGRELLTADVTVSSSPLHEAVKFGNDCLVTVLLNYGASVNGQNDIKESPLHLATSGSMAECLLKQGAQVNAVTISNETPLYIACKHRCLDVVETLLRYGADPNELHSYKIPLVVACINNDIGIVRTLLMSRANPNVEISQSTIKLVERQAAADTQDSPRYGKRARSELSDGTEPAVINDADRTSLLHVMCKKGFLEIVETILSNAANVNSVDSFGRLPLHYAVEYVSEEDEQPCSQSSDAKATGAVTASVHNHVIADTMAKMLVRHGADINWCDVTGRTALHCAIEVACFKESGMSALQHIDFLLQIEANVNTVSRDRESPLYAACVMGHTEVMSRLLLHGARVADGRLLLAACDREHFPAVTLLLSYGADPNASVQSEEIVPQNYGDSTNAESGSTKCITAECDSANLSSYTYQKTLVGKLPLCVATEKGNTRIINVLMKNNADTNLRDGFGKAALHYACKKNDFDVVKLILQAGADPNLPTESIGNQVERLPLCIASEGGSGRILELLLDSKADVHRKEGEGRTALHCAVMFAVSHRGIYDINRRSHYGEAGKRSWRTRAISCSDDSDSYSYTEKYSVDDDISVDGDSDDDGDSNSDVDSEIDDNCAKNKKSVNVDSSRPIDDAVEIDRYAEVVVHLLDHGADVNAVDDKGRTALLVAVERGLIDVVRLILEDRRVDPNCTGCGRHPLNVACARGDMASVVLLLQAGADPNLETPRDVHIYDEYFGDDNSEDDCVPLASLPLGMAAETGDLPMIKTLVKFGAKTNILDSNGNGVLSYLFDDDYFPITADGDEMVSVVKLLLEGGADPSGRNEYGETPIRMLVPIVNSRDVSEVVKALIEYGAKLDDSGLNLGERCLNQRFQLSDCIGSSLILQQTAFDLFRAGAGRKLLSLSCKSETLNVYIGREVGNETDLRLCLAIVLDGYRASDDDVKCFEMKTCIWDPRSRSSKSFVDFYSWLIEDRKQPPSLMRQCRAAIRRQLSLAAGHRTILPLMDVLPLPDELASYMKYEGPLSEVDLTGKYSNGPAFRETLNPCKLLVRFNAQDQNSRSLSYVCQCN